MRSALVLTAILFLSGCASSSGSLGSIGSIGSLSFGGTRSAAAPATRQTLPDLVPEGRRIVITDSRSLAAQVTSAELTPTPAGALLRATGRPAAAGAYNAELVPAGRENGTLSFGLRMSLQHGSRIEPGEVSAARVLSRADLAGISRIRVIGASGSRDLRP